MCIEKSVGHGGANLPDDVRTVQLMLAAGSTAEPPPVACDGCCGSATVDAITAFQRRHADCRDEAGLVTPDLAADGSGTTLRSLRHELWQGGFSQAMLHALLLHARVQDVANFVAPLRDGMAAGEITTPLRQAHFLAQVAHESGELRYTEELTSGAAYEGRRDLGNTQPGDGVLFKGRGLLQITGRANYAAFGRSCGEDLCGTNGPQGVATEPVLAVGAAVWFWTTHGLNTLADRDDLDRITERINGGRNGLADRQAKLERAKWFLMASA